LSPALKTGNSEKDGKHADLSASEANQSVMYKTGRMSRLRLREHCRQKPAAKPSDPLYCISSSNSTLYIQISQSGLTRV